MPFSIAWYRRARRPSASDSLARSAVRRLVAYPGKFGQRRLSTERDIAQVAFNRAAAEMHPDAKITEDKIAAFVEVMRANVLTGDIPFRRAYLRAVIDNVEVDDTEIRIHGRRTVLERLVMGGGASPAGVPSFVRKWRTRQDSNLWPLPSEGSALSS